MTDDRVGTGRELGLVGSSPEATEPDRGAGLGGIGCQLFDRMLLYLLIACERELKMAAIELAVFTVGAGDCHRVKGVQPEQPPDAFAASIAFEVRVGR